METIFLSLFNSLMPYIISFLEENKSNNDILDFKKWLKENNPKILTEIEKSSKNITYVKALLNENIPKLEQITKNQDTMLEYLNSVDEIKFQNEITHSKLDDILEHFSTEPRFKEIIESLFLSTEIKGLSNVELINKSKDKIESLKSYERDNAFIDEELNVEIKNKINDGKVSDAKSILSNAFKKNLDRNKVIDNQLALQAFHLGQLSFILSQYGEAKYYYSKAVNFDNENLKYLRKLASIESLLGLFHDSLNNYEKIHQIYISSMENNSLKYADALSDLGYAYEQVGDFRKALIYYEEANKITEKLIGRDNDSYNTTLNNIAHLYCIMGAEPNQINLLYKALKLFEQVHNVNIILYGKSHKDTGASFNNIGGVFLYLSRYKKALFNFEMAHSIYINNKRNDYFETAIIKMNIGLCLNNIGRHCEALRYYQTSEEILLKFFDVEHPDICNLRYNKALCFEDLGMFHEAVKEMESVYLGYCNIFGELKPQTRKAKKQFMRLKTKL